MNDEKRKRIDEYIAGIQKLCVEEAQDLVDTPDNIEDQGAIRDKFITSIRHLNQAVEHLEAAKG